MTIDNPNPPWLGSTYSGFAGPALAAAAPPAPATPSRGPRKLSRRLMLVGIAVAGAAGVALGFVAQPREVSAAKAEAAATPLLVELAAPAPMPAVRSTGKLDVRPAAETTPPTVTAPRPLPLPAPDIAPRAERLEPPPAIREAPPPEIELSRPADAPDDPEIYEEIEEPTG